MRNFKILILVPILLASLFSLSGCGYNDVQKDRQEKVEKALKYVNEKYAEDPSFKKYERKDIVSNSSFCTDMISGVTRDVCGNGTAGGASGVVEFKDGNRVYDGKIDTRQGEQIRADFEKYFYNEIINAEYTNETITDFSESYTSYPHNQDAFDKYYDGNIKNYVTDESITFRGNVTIIVDKKNLDEYYEELIARIKNINMNLYIDYDILFINKEQRDSIIKFDTSGVDNRSFKDEKILAMVKIEGSTKQNNINARKYVTCGSGYGMRLSDKNININLGDITITKSNIKRGEIEKESTEADKANDINKNSSIKIGDNSYIVCYDEIYEVKISQRINNIIEQSGSGYILVDVWIGSVDSSFDMGYVLLDH